jgi:hypothetical protein
LLVTALGNVGVVLTERDIYIIERRADFLALAHGVKISALNC